MVWHQRTRPSAAQQWLRSALSDAAKVAFMHAKSPSRRIKKLVRKSHKKS
jgi:hypothetical protein